MPRSNLLRLFRLADEPGFADDIPASWLDPDWLAREGRAHIPGLIAVLNDPGWHYEGPRALGALGAVEAIPALGRLAVRGLIGETAVTTALAALVADPDPHVRAAAEAVTRRRRP